VRTAPPLRRSARWRPRFYSCTSQSGHTSDGTVVADASLNRRMTVRLGDAVAFAQIGVVGLDGQIELEALRLYGLPEEMATRIEGRVS
jgi:hypothetical protein